MERIMRLMGGLRPWWHRPIVRRLGTNAALRALLEAAGCGIALLDAEGRILAWNSALSALAGPTLPVRIGLPATALVAAEARERLSAAMAAGVPLDAPLAAAGGTRVTLTRIALPAPETGAILRVAEAGPGTRMEETLAAAARLQAVGQLAGGIAHDFNNLLAAIAASAEAVAARGQDPESAADLQQILESAGRGAGLVKQLLAFARQQALQPRVVELNAAVTAVGAMLHRLLGKRVQLDFALEEPGRRVRIDPVQLDQVIVNLALNARDAMPAGGTLRIGTDHAVVLRPQPIGAETLPPGRYAVIEVSDTGKGIPPETLPRIFEPFFTTRREQGGTGLGLATVHGILRQSGGFIAVESRVGQGTRFRIWLPRHDGPAEAGAPPPAPACPVTAIPPKPCPVVVKSGACPVTTAAPEGAEILLVEDEPPLLRLAERALTRAGFRVRAAASAEDALALLEREGARPRALVSDVVMPGADGFELAARLREAQPDLPVLLVSGYAEAALGRDLAAERLTLLAKPYRLEELVGAVRRLLAPESVAAE